MGDACFGWVWYLANDMQFFIVSPVLVLAYCINRKFGYISTISFILTSMIINGSLTLYGNVSPMLVSENIDSANLMYGKPWTRMGAYFVGAVFGLSYFEFSKKENHMELSYSTFNKIYTHLEKSKITCYIFLVFGIGLTALYVFPLRNYAQECGTFMVGTAGEAKNCWSIVPSFLYNLTSRPLFVLGVSLIIIPTFVGRLTLIKGLLSAEIFSVMARISYIAYLIHPLVIFWFIFDQRQAMYVSNLNQWFFAIGNLVVTYAFSIPFSLLSEAPFMNIEKYVLFAPKKVDSLEGKENGGKYHSLAEDSETMPSMRKIIED